VGSLLFAEMPTLNYKLTAATKKRSWGPANKKANLLFEVLAFMGSGGA